MPDISFSYFQADVQVQYFSSSTEWYYFWQDKWTYTWPSAARSNWHIPPSISSPMNGKARSAISKYAHLQCELRISFASLTIHRFFVVSLIPSITVRCSRIRSEAYYDDLLFHSAFILSGGWIIIPPWWVVAYFRRWMILHRRF